jgi:hypothetical protein
MRSEGAIRVPAATKSTLRIAKTVHSAILPVNSPAKWRACLAPYPIPHSVNTDEEMKATGNTATHKTASRINTGFKSDQAIRIQTKKAQSSAPFCFFEREIRLYGILPGQPPTPSGLGRAMQLWRRCPEWRVHSFLLQCRMRKLHSRLGCQQ